MREQFRETRFRPESLARIKQMIEIIAEYRAQGLRMTARQLYYQFVSRDFIRNTPREYQNLTALLTSARYAGLVDWAAIEDRGRVPSRPSEWDSIQDIVDTAVQAYRLPRWRGQPNYVELWVEKQALAGVLAPLASEYHVTLMVNKGYSSASAMYEAAQRINTYGEGKPCFVLYLGDHDPSGEDMVRDIQDRLDEFGCQDLEVRKIALTLTQIREHRPPPNPAKVTDSRAAAYIAKFGDSSWEVDALPPDVLARIVRANIEAEMDADLMDEVKLREESDKENLRKAARAI